MKKNNMKFVLIPAFAAAALFPVLANDNQAKAGDDKATTASTVNNTVSNSEKSASVSTTNNVAETTPAGPANPASNVVPANTASSVNPTPVLNNE